MHFDQTESTNTVGRFLMSTVRYPGSVAITADRQTQGRGSHGRVWHSEDAGGFYYSLAIPSIRPELLPTLTVAVAERCQKVLQDLWEISVDIEWPNDLILNGKKVGGILVETVTSGNAPGPCGIIGIGLNINQDRFPDDLRAVAISVKMVDGKVRSLAKLKENLTKELLAWL